MAKQTKSAVAPAKEQVTNAASVAAPAADGTIAAPATPKKVNIKEPNGKDIFKRVLVDGKGSPLTHKNAKGETIPLNTPQVKVIANLLEAKGDAGMTRKELCDALPGAGLVTRQPVGRIVSYYQKDMVENGIITIVKDTTVATPVPPAAAAEVTPAVE